MGKDNLIKMSFEPIGFSLRDCGMPTLNNALILNYISTDIPPRVSGIHCAINNSCCETSNEVFTIHMTMSFESSAAIAHFSPPPRLSGHSFKVFSCIIVFMFCYLTFILGAQRLLFVFLHNGEYGRKICHGANARLWTKRMSKAIHL